MAELILSEHAGSIRELSLKSIQTALPKHAESRSVELHASTSSSPYWSQPSTGRARRAVPFIIGVAGGTASGKTVSKGDRQLLGSCQSHFPM